MQDDPKRVRKKGTLLLVGNVQEKERGHGLGTVIWNNQENRNGDGTEEGYGNNPDIREKKTGHPVDGRDNMAMTDLDFHQHRGIIEGKQMLLYHL